VTTSRNTSKTKVYAKNALFFFLIIAIVYVPQILPFLKPMRDFFVQRTGWNWSWPLSLFLGTVLGTFLIQVDREEEAKPKLRLAGLLFVAVYFVLRLGIPHGALTATRLIGIPFMFFSAFLEEFLFRRIGFEALRKLEERFYKDPNLKRLGPVSLLYTCFIAGLLHGVGPLFANRSFDWGAYATTFDTSVFYSFLYVLSRSVWVPGFAHFLANLTRILW
jgi:membrane protease YdiL (CAAX protease family)